MSPAAGYRDEVERLGKASRRSAIMGVLGVVIVLASLLFASLQLYGLQKEKQTLVEELRSAGDNLVETRKTLSDARSALAASRLAINAFHARRYEDAIILYDEALNYDPQNAYILNLRAYAYFKLHNYTKAIEEQRNSVAADPTYAWGYFDLARFLCADTPPKTTEARQAAERAIALRPGIKSTMMSDGEFRRVCRDILPQIFSESPEHDK